MILDAIIDKENEYIKRQRTPPTVVEMSYSQYCTLIKELETSRFIHRLHGLTVVIITQNQITVR